MKDVPKYVVVIPQDDGSLYPIKFHSDYDEAVITANNHDASSSKKAQIRSDGPEVWKAFEERERQEKNKVSPGTKSEDDGLTVDEMNEILNDDSPPLNPDEVSPETKVRLDNLRKETGKLVEFAERLEQKMAMIPVVDPSQLLSNAYFYEYVPTEDVRPHGLLFWGPRDTKLFSIKVNNEEQFMMAGESCIYIASFMNPYGSYEILQHWVKHKVKLQYTNLALPAIKLGSKITVMVDKPCTICVCGVKYE